MKKVVIVTDSPKKNYTEDTYDTIFQVNNIKEALIALGYQTEIVYFDLNLDKFSHNIINLNPDIIFNMVEDEHYIYYPPIIFESLGIKFTGADSSLLILTNNKIKLKKFLQNRNFSFKIPNYLTLEENTLKKDYSDIIIKPISRHGSFSIDENSVIKNITINEIKEILKNKSYTTGIEYFAEEYIDGREFNIGYLNKSFLPFSEIIFKDYDDSKPKIVDYSAKWIPNSFEYHSTVRNFNFNNFNNISEKLKRASTELIDFLKIKTFFRFDFRVENNSDIYLIDINLNPCLSNLDGFYSACKEKNISYNDMIQMILNEVYV